MEPPEHLLRIVPDGLVTVKDIDIRALSKMFDELDVYVSIYLPTASKEDARENQLFVQRRSRGIRMIMSGELSEEFDRTLGSVTPYLDSDPIDGERGRMIFASSKMGFVHVYRIPVAPYERRMVLDTSPYIMPLAKLRDDYMEYGMLIMDSQNARFLTISSDHCTIVSEEGIDLMNKHKKGGMSQARFNRLRSGAINHFVKEVLEDIQGFGGLKDLRGIVIAGPGETKKLLEKALPKEVRDMVMGTLDIDVDANCSELVTLGNDIASKDEEKRGMDAVEELRAAILRGDPSAYGAGDIINAFGSGRVDRLIVLKTASIPGWICERCQMIESNKEPPALCTKCGGPTSKVNVVEEIVELAERTRSAIEFVHDSAFLGSIGGLGALLRF
jgi:peptide chain release factor subunit 1